MTGVAKRLAGYALLVIAGIVLLKIVIGTIVGAVKMVLVVGLLLLVILATMRLTRRN